MRRTRYRQQFAITALVALAGASLGLWACSSTQSTPSDAAPDSHHRDLARDHATDASGGADLPRPDAQPIASTIWVTSFAGGEVWWTGRSTLDQSGNIYHTGFFKGSLTVGTTTLTSKGDWEAFVVKLSPAGQPLWAVSAGGTSSTSGAQSYSVNVDSQGNVYIAGAFSGQAAFGTTTLSSQGKADIFVAKLSSSGAFIWAKFFGGSGDDVPEGDGAIDASGNLILAGFFSGQVTFGTTTLTGKGTMTAFLAKFDPDGTVLWATALGDNNSIWSSAQDSSGNLYLAGWFEGSATFGSTTLTSAGKEDLFVAKVSATGQPVWAISAGGTEEDQAEKLVLDKSGNSYIAGGFSGQAKFGSTTLSSGGGLDVYLAKVSPAGSFLWATSVEGSAYDEYGTGVALDSKESPVLIGISWGKVVFGPVTLVGKSGCDVFVARYTTSGSPTWARLAGGGHSTDQTYGTSVLLDGDNAIVSGSFSGLSSFGSTTLTAKGTKDLFVWKLKLQ